MMNSANVGHVLNLLKGSDIYHLRAYGVCKVSTFDVVNVDDASSRGKRGGIQVYDVHKNTKNCLIAIDSFNYSMHNEITRFF